MKLGTKEECYLNMNRVICMIMILLLFLSSSDVKGQDMNTSMFFDHLTINEGLSHNTVYCLLQDKHGYIWIGTQDGLNKYDGYSFKVFRSDKQEKDESGFEGKSITALFEDKSNNLWVGTRRQGINLKKTGSKRFINFKTNPHFNPIKEFGITSFLEDELGNIWIGTDGGGILLYNPKKGTTKHFNSELGNLDQNMVFDLKQDKYGTIWVATNGVGICYWNPQETDEASFNNTVQYPNYGGFRKSILVDNDTLWLGGEGAGIYKLNIINKEFEQVLQGIESKDLNSNLVRDIIKWDDHQFYIATDGGGLNIYNTENQEIQKHTYSSNSSMTLNTNALFCFLKDRTGNLWIGSYNGGINIYKKNKTWFDFFTPTLGKGDELKHRSVLAIHESKDGKIWIGTDGGGLNWLENKNNQFSFSSLNNDNLNGNTLGGNVVKTVFEDSNNQLWIGFYGNGMDMYNPKTNSLKKFRDSYNENTIKGTNIWTITEQKNGKLWFGTMGAGINVLDPKTDKFTQIREESTETNSISDNNIMVLFADDEDKVWVGTMDSGLSIWDDENAEFKHFQYNPNDSTSIGSNEIRTIFQDSKNNIWIGTEDGGLNRWLGNGKFERITKADGLIANSIMGITEDIEGYIWMTTYKGVSRMNPENKTIKNFDFHDETNSNQFNQMSILSASDGRLFFGGINGLNAIKLENIIDRIPSPDIIFTDFKIFGKSVKIGKLDDNRVILNKPIEDTKVINLKYFDNSFSFDFSGIDFTNPQSFRYQYKMEGFNTDWQQTDLGQHSVSYTNLDPGTYNFKVRLFEKEISVKLIIAPPIWKTIWFRILMFIIGTIATIGTGYFFLKRREEAHKQELLKAESQILQLQNEKLASEVSAKNSKLMFSSIQMAHKNEVLNVVKKDIEKGVQNPTLEVRSLLRRLETEVKNEDYWDEFNIYFNQVDQDFVKSLILKHPQLTQNDIRICTLIRLQLNTKEIASLLNITTRGVEKSRSRLKKRLELDTKDNLLKYILNFES